jgi:hypothetical protein
MELSSMRCLLQCCSGCDETCAVRQGKFQLSFTLLFSSFSQKNYLKFSLEFLARDIQLLEGRRNLCHECRCHDLHQPFQEQQRLQGKWMNDMNDGRQKFLTFLHVPAWDMQLLGRCYLCQWCDFCGDSRHHIPHELGR